MLPEGFRRTREEIERLLDQAQVELDFPWKEHHPDRMLTMWCSRPPEAARGVKECCLWVLGRRPTGPLTGRTTSYPLSKEELAKENFRARDVVEQLIPEWQQIGDDYAAAFIATLKWLRGSDDERPIAEPGTKLH
ncbi:hypothetical protein AB0E96_37540 [Kitasatospora sp. NPDC036755]|uniref:hypothetical protein n=1 Tax=Kitasatospora sp. NPDC036755 TaxID=3154600 RepID=UPI0033F433C9